LHRPPRLALGLNPESRRDEELRGGANDVLGSHVEIPHHFLKRDREDSVLSRKPKRYAVEKRRDARSVSGQPSEVILRRTVKSMKLVGRNEAESLLLDCFENRLAEPLDVFEAKIDDTLDDVTVYRLLVHDYGSPFRRASLALSF